MKNEMMSYSYLTSVEVDVSFYDMLAYCEEEGLTILDLLHDKKDKRTELIYNYLTVEGYDPYNFPASVIKAIDKDFVKYMSEEE